MKTAIVAALCILAFAPPASQAQAQNVPMVITSDYYAQPRVLVVHALNNSGKDITGYTIIIRHKNPDGTIEQGGWSEQTSDVLPLLITRELAKDPAASEQTRLQNIGNKAFDATGNGIFLAGATRDMTLNGIDNGNDVDISVGVAFYSDGSYDQQNEDAFKRMLAYRQHELQQMKDENQLIENALADPTNEHPVAGVLTELNKRRVEEMNKPNRFPMSLSDSELRNMQQPTAYGPDKGKTERERLTQFVQDQEKRVELTTPHCHLEIDTTTKQ